MRQKEQGRGYTLALEGRDVDQYEIDVRRNYANRTWELAEGAEGIKQGSRRAEVLRTVEEGDGLVTCMAIAEVLSMHKQSVHAELTALGEAGMVVGKREGREVFYARVKEGDSIQKDLTLLTE